MKVKALKSFGGLVSMKKGEIRDVDDEVIISDLISAGYVELEEEAKKAAEEEAKKAAEEAKKAAEEEAKKAAETKKQEQKARK